MREGARAGVREALAQRDAADMEAIAQANAILDKSSGRLGQRPFTAGEYTKILCFALAEGTTTPERREEALKLVNVKKFLLREVRGRRPRE